jgi:hypothetical protein
LANREKLENGILWAALGLSVLVLSITLMGSLFKSVQHDEAFTILNYILEAPGGLWERYHPNNHLLFSALAAVLGSAIEPTESVFRLGSVVPAIVSSLLLGVWSYNSVGLPGTLSVVALPAILPIHYLLVSEARGYGLALLASTVLVIAAKAHSDNTSGRRAVVLVSLATLVGALTLPQFIIYAAAVTCVLFLYSERKRLLVLAQGISVGLVAVVYAPIIARMLSWAGSDFGSEVGMGDLLWGFPKRTLHHGLVSHFPDGIEVPMISIVGILALIGAIIGKKRLQRTRIICVVAVIAPYATAMVLGLSIADRTFFFLLSPFLALVGLGLQRCVEFSSPKIRTIVVVVLALVVGIGSWLIVGVFLSVNMRPVEEFKGAAAVVDSVEYERLIISSKRPQGLRWYLGRKGEWFNDREKAIKRICESESSSRLLFVDHPFLQEFEGTRCLGAKWVRHEIKQNARGGFIAVWVRGR